MRLLKPVRWTPPVATERAAGKRSTPELPPVSLLPLPGAGPEDVVVGPDGRLLTGVADGRVLRVDPAGGAVEVVGDTGGRPLGLHAEADGSVLVCDHDRGVLRMSPDGRTTVLLDRVGGRPLRFASNVVAGPDGMLYVSASTQRFDLAHYRGDLMEHSGTGRLLRLAPDGEVEVLLEGLHFANGVVLAPDASFLLVAETGAYRITRFWLTGPRAGSSETFLDNLPGFPDNMLVGSDGLVWVALASPRNPLLDRLLPLPGVLRQAAWLLPDTLQPTPEQTAWVLGVSFAGEVVHDLQRPDGYHLVTSVCEVAGTLYLGSLAEPALAVTSVPSG